MSESPDSAHDFARLSRVTLSDADEKQIVEDTLEGHMHVDDFRQLLSDERQKSTFHGMTHVTVFLRWLAHNDRLIDWTLAVSQAGDMKHWIESAKE